MRIAINTRFLLEGKMEGFGWYTYEVVRRIVAQNPQHTFYFFFDRPFDSRFVFADNVQPIILSPPARHPFLFWIWFEISVKRALKKNKIDLFFSPDGYLSLRSKVKQVGVIHDINFEHFPKDLPFLASWYLRRYFPRFAKKASHILTVSQFSKNDIVKTYGIDPQKIEVAYNGASSLFVPNDETEKAQVKVKYANGKNYFLFVGSLQPRKNLNRLLQAFSNLVEKGQTDWDLVIVGSKMWANTSDGFENQELIQNRVHFLGHLKQEKLIAVTASASALVFVPYYEGFGIPVIEAMKCGVPVIAGNRTALPEIAGDAALLCDPFSVEDIQEKMQLLEGNISLQEDLRQKGLVRGSEFSWDKTAQEVWRVLEAQLEQVSANKK